MYFAYSKAINQIARVDRAMLTGGAAAQNLPAGHPDKKTLQRRPMAVTLRRYLMQQIVRMETGKSKQAAAAIKQKKKNVRRLEAELKYGTDEPSAVVLPDSDIYEHLRHQLSCLPQLTSRIVRMRIWEELSFAEIGRQLNMPESTVRARYQSALLQLRKFYTEDLA
jgi:DNA-directed RNA polymerase specialized sigma subunit